MVCEGFNLATIWLRPPRTSIAAQTLFLGMWFRVDVIRSRVGCYRDATLSVRKNPFLEGTPCRTFPSACHTRYAASSAALSERLLPKLLQQSGPEDHVHLGRFVLERHEQRAVRHARLLPPVTARAMMNR